MNLVRHVLTLSLALLCVGAANSHLKTLIFQVRTGEMPNAARLSVAVMKARLRAAHIPAAITLLSGDRVRVSLQHADTHVVALLEHPGRVKFRITPSGPTFGDPRIVAANADHYLDDPATPAVNLTLADGARFHKFTQSHINEYLGIYLDGKLLTAPRIVAPMDNAVYIVGGGLTDQDARWIASLLAGGPLPAQVRLIKG